MHPRGLRHRARRDRPADLSAVRAVRSGAGHDHDHPGHGSDATGAGRSAQAHRRDRARSCTTMFGSPALLDVLGRHAEASGTRLATLRRVISAGAPVPPDVVARACRTAADDATFWTPYGATECLPVAVIEGREILRSASARHRRRRRHLRRSAAGRQHRCASSRIDDGSIPRWREGVQVPHGRGRRDHRRRSHRRPAPTSAARRRPRWRRSARRLPDGSERIVHRMGDLGWFDRAGPAVVLRTQVAPRAHAKTAHCSPNRSKPVFNTHPDVRRTALVGLGAGDAQRAGAVRRARARATGTRCAPSWPRIGASHAMSRGIATLPAPSGIPGRHPPQRQDRPRGARALGRARGPARAQRGTGAGSTLMRVLVTGGGGFLGSAICRLLRARGDEVVSLTRGHYPQLEWLGVRQVAGDIASLDAVLRGEQGLRRGDPYRGQGRRLGRAGGLLPGQCRRHRPRDRGLLHERHRPPRVHLHAQRGARRPRPRRRRRARAARDPLQRALPARPRRSPNSACARPTGRTWPRSRCARTWSGARATTTCCRAWCGARAPGACASSARPQAGRRDLHRQRRAGPSRRARSRASPAPTAPVAPTSSATTRRGSSTTSSTRCSTPAGCPR